MRIPEDFMNPFSFLAILHDNYQTKENEYLIVGINIDQEMSLNNPTGDKLRTPSLIQNNGKLIHGVRKDIMTLDSFITYDLLREKGFVLGFPNSIYTWELQSIEGDVYIRFIQEEHERLKGNYKPRPLVIKN